VPLELIASKDTFNQQNIDVMDRVMVPSLMVRFPGTTQNYPVFRDGSIAMLAEEPISFQYPIEGKLTEVKQQAILINATVNRGFSGTPILLWPGPRLIGNSVAIGSRPWLLGVVSGFFPEKYPVVDQNGNPVSISVKGPSPVDPVKQVNLLVDENSAIAFATPAWRILEVLETGTATNRLEELIRLVKKEKSTKAE